MIEQKKLSPLVRLVDDDEMVLRSESGPELILVDSVFA